MNKFVTTFAFVFLLQADAYAGLRPLARYYKLIPEDKALTTSGAASLRELSAKSIKTLIWNVKKASIAGWDKEFTTFGKDRDLFLVQEAMENASFENTLATFTGIRWDIGLSFLYTIYGDAGTGSMVGSVAEPVEVKVLHSPDYEPVVETPKSSTVAKYPLDGSDKDLMVISVHGINLTNFASFKRHMLQLRSEIERHDGPVIFAGDFNTRTQARTQFLDEMAKELKFTPVEFKNGEARMKFKFTPYYLDHSYVRGLKVKNAEVIVESFGSDHKPMQMEVEVLP